MRWCRSRWDLMNAPARSSPMTRAASSAQGVASARRGNRISIIGGSGGDGARRDCYYTRMPTLEVSTQTVHYVQTGGGAPALVLIHGAGGDHGTWTRQLEGLADSATVVALDLPGHGASSRWDGVPSCSAVTPWAAPSRKRWRSPRPGCSKASSWSAPERGSRYSPG